MKGNGDDFLDDIKLGLDAERNADYGMKPAEAEKLMARYPKDTPAGYEKIDASRFFDGN